MKTLQLWRHLASIFLQTKATRRLLLASLLGVAFSQTVILGTLGLMDGFEETLIQALRSSSGDWMITHPRGFFEWSKSDAQELSPDHQTRLTPVIQVEAFISRGALGAGLLLRGIEPTSFLEVTKLSLPLAQDEIILGKQLAKKLQLRKGDQTQVLLKGNADPLSPLFQTFTVKGVVDHGIYEKDLRYAYVPSENLKKILGLSTQQYNLVLARGNVLFNSNNKKSSETKLWIIKPSWKEFSPLIEAVEIEKKSIALILQVIVIVAVFNIAGFLIAMRLQKAQEVFLLRSLGLSFRQLFAFTLALLLVLWAFSTATSWVMVQLLDMALVNLSLFQLPGDIYVLSRLSLKLDRFAYGLVFLLTLVWIFLISAPSLWRWSKQSVLSGLREEFK